MSGKKKRKTIPPLPEDLDLHRVFGEEPEVPSPPPDFIQALTSIPEEKLPELAEILGEKKHKPEKKHSLRERLKSYPPPRETLDLHGLTGPEAALKTESFLKNSRFQQLLTVRIITGKGLHSPGGAVLPDVVEERLKKLKDQGQILTFHWDHHQKKQSGSVIVYLP
ncbi:MAG: Smr/MutS family protein [Proteobacteria bacterium]|nr:Smr/MutS family protein [Pseudomonadota bacterium]MBU1688549.1 Smr/MutS family protein [Pseudomonadota bacterium]